MRWFAACLCLLLGSSPAFAQPTAAQAAEAAAADLAQAAALLTSAEGARDRVSALTETVQAFEAGLGALRSGMRQVHLARTALEAELAGTDAKVHRLLGALMSAETQTRVVDPTHPNGPLASARASMIMADILPALQNEADGLRARLDELERLRLLQSGAEATLREGLDGVRTARAELAAAIADRTAGEAATDDATLQALVNSADTLDGFASSLASSEAVETASIAGLKGTLQLPHGATLLRDQRPGLTLSVPAQTLVIAPVAGTLRYAGPLLDLGDVAILEPEQGTLIVYAGLGQAFGQAGDILSADAPLGFMGGEDTRADQILIETRDGTGHDPRETLYIEIRQGEAHSDPAEWYDLTEAEEP
ncbi:MAG: peptidoglycan DD-metalloendopeptidase family protein [Pseudomonadota bacterium]